MLCSDYFMFVLFSFIFGVVEIFSGICYSYSFIYKAVLKYILVHVCLCLCYLTINIEKQMLLLLISILFALDLMLQPSFAEFCLSQ